VKTTLNLCLILAGGLLLLGCQSEPAEESADELPADTLAAPTISLADIAGTWDMRSVPLSGVDTTATVYQIDVTPDGITFLLPDRDPVVAAVTTSGDSVIVDAGPFESLRRAGMMVSTHSVYRLESDRLMGSVVAHYVTSDADSVLNLSAEGTRAP
jgi:hypothetical protein